MQSVALRDQNLRAHDVDSGNDFGHGMLDLNARIHLDKEPLIGVDIEQKLNSSRVVVTDFARDAHRGVAQFLSRLRIQIDTGRDLDDFLMASLNTAIALVQMNDFAPAVAQNLHFDVLGARDVFLQENRIVAKRATGFLLRFVQQ